MAEGPQSLPASAQPQKIELSLSDIKALANQKKDFEVCKLDRDATTVAYKKCIADDHPPVQWWQTPEYAIAAPLLLLILGIASGSQLIHR